MTRAETGDFSAALREHAQTIAERTHEPSAAPRDAVRDVLGTMLRERGSRVAGSLFAPATASALDALPPAPMPGSIAELGSAYAALLDHSTRKRTGAWFTGSALVQPTVDRTLRPLLERGTDPLALRIVDPAAGAGAFLVAALEHLAVHTGLPRAELARHCLHGIELDPTAAALAAWTLWEAAGDPSLEIAELERNVHAGDGLLDLPKGSFDAVLGNPPWETVQCNHAENEDADLPWLRAAASGRARELRRHFRHQGKGKLQTYRLFTEQAVALLRRGGRLGLLLPASLWFDRGARPVRELLLGQCRWEWLFAFENRRGLFPIDCRYRFGAVIAEKGGTTHDLRAAFGRIDPASWSQSAPEYVRYPRSQVDALSPHSGALVEVGHERDLAILQHMHARGAPFLTATGGAMTFAQGDLNMTSDAARFVACPELMAQGYTGRDDGSLRRQQGDPVYWPLLQGAMVWDFRAVAAGHSGGTGRGSRWSDTAPGVLQPQFAVADGDRRRRTRSPARLLFRVLSNATNERTVVCALAPPTLPAGNSLGVLVPAQGDSLLPCAFGCGVMGSLVFDWALRLRLGGTNLNQFVLADTVWPRASEVEQRHIALLALRLSAVHPWDGPIWQSAIACGIAPEGGKMLAAVDAGTRSAVRAQLDVAVARAFGLTAEDLAWILRGCAHDAAQLRELRFTRNLDQKGFWRIDRQLPPDRRHPAAVLRSFGNAAAVEA